MKKNLMKVGLAAVLAAMMMTGCKNDAGNETTAAKTENSKSSITIGDYKALTLTAEKTEVTDEMVEEQLNALCEMYPTEVTGRAAELGDTANIDFAGYKDGTAFDGGTSEGYDLVLGSGSFIDGFEDGVVGMNIGEEKDLDLTFPENYGSEELAGQDVVFHVTLNSLASAEETEVDDALAKRVMEDESATLEDLRTDIKEQLENNAELTYFNEAGLELLNQVIENSEITCDTAEIDEMYDQLQTTYTLYANQYGLDLATYLTYFLQTDEEGLREIAEEMIKQEMVLNEIIEKETLTATDEQKNTLAQMNYFDSAEEMTEQLGEESAERLYQMGAAYYYLMENAVRAE